MAQKVSKKARKANYLAEEDIWKLWSCLFGLGWENTTTIQFWQITFDVHCVPSGSAQRAILQKKSQELQLDFKLILCA